jgi:cold shock CspA family protein
MNGVVTGTVKFFNSILGYGFIYAEDMKGDIFIHKKKLEELKLPLVEIGDQIVCETKQKHDDKYAVCRIKEYTPLEQRPDLVNGVIDAYYDNKGYGFIKVLDTERKKEERHFFHVSALKPYGIDTVKPGVRVRFVLGRHYGRQCVMALQLLE